jgi:hypothetical protein
MRLNNIGPAKLVPRGLRQFRMISAAQHRNFRTGKTDSTFLPNPRDSVPIGRFAATSADTRSAICNLRPFLGSEHCRPKFERRNQGFTLTISGTSTTISDFL